MFTPEKPQVFVTKSIFRHKANLKLKSYGSIPPFLSLSLSLLLSLSLFLLSLSLFQNCLGIEPYHLFLCRQQIFKISSYRGQKNDVSIFIFRSKAPRRLSFLSNYESFSTFVRSSSMICLHSLLDPERWK